MNLDSQRGEANVRRMFAKDGQDRMGRNPASDRIENAAQSQEREKRPWDNLGADRKPCIRMC